MKEIVCLELFSFLKTVLVQIKILYMLTYSFFHVLKNVVVQFLQKRALEMPLIVWRIFVN